MALGFVRPARPEDAAEIARIQLATWRVAYRRLLPRHVLDNLDEAWIAAAVDRRGARAAVTAPPRPRRRRAGRAIVSGGVRGLRARRRAGPGPEEEPLPEDVVAVTDLLVEPRWGRRGHGSRLLAASVDLWREDGFATAVAWAYDGDPATRKFLGSAGWEPDGAARALDVDDMLVPQLRLHVTLSI